MREEGEKNSVDKEDFDESDKILESSVSEGSVENSVDGDGSSDVEDQPEKEDSEGLSSPSINIVQPSESDGASESSEETAVDTSHGGAVNQLEQNIEISEKDSTVESDTDQNELSSASIESELTEKEEASEIKSEPVAVEKQEVEMSKGEDGRGMVDSEPVVISDKKVESETASVQDQDSQGTESEIEKSVESEESDSVETEKEEERHLDYSDYSKKQLVQVLESLVKEDDYSRVGAILKEIKKPYDQISKLERKEAFDKYVADGGEKDGFEFRSDELDQRFQKSYSDLKEKRNQYFNSLEKQKERNLNLKLEILEKIRELVDSEETGVSIKSLKELQSQWKEVGVIASSQVKSLWANYNALLDRFYDQRSIYFELKELDRRKNYELKIELCEKAEQLESGENVREIIKQLNELHDEFKHIGPVPKEDQEVVWERFKTASDKIYSKRKDYYDKLKDEFKINAIAKDALVEKVKPFAEFTSDKISDWNSKTKEIISIQKEWELIGSLLKEKAKNINKQFWSSFKTFFHNKGLFFRKIEEERKENLKLKQELVAKAEAIKDSEDFGKTADELKRLQLQWKETGPVPEKYRNEIYLQFKKACDHFFNRRRANSGELEKGYEENLLKKQVLCAELDKMIESNSIDIDRVRTIETEWEQIGFVPKSNIKSIQKQYLDAIRGVTEKVDLPEVEKQKLMLSAQFNKTNYSVGAEKLLMKKEGALRRQISTLENEVNLWKNNIDFFASSKNADKLKEEFQNKIDNASNQLENLKQQLKVIINI